MTIFGGLVATAVALFGAGLTVAAPAVFAEEAPLPQLVDSHVEALAQRVEEGLAPQVPEVEAARHKLIAEAAAGTAWPEIAGRKPAYVSLRDSGGRALEKNLRIAIANLGRSLAEAALEESKAVFDPIFSLSLSYNYTDTFRRTKGGFLRQKALQAFAPTGYMCIENPQPGTTSGQCSKSPQRASPAVIAMKYANQNAGIVFREIDASKDTENNANQTKAATYTAGLSQILPWGPQVSLSHVTRQQPIYYKKGYYWDDGTVTSNLIANLSSPLPFTKGFGEFSPFDAAVKRQKLNEERTLWSVKGSINGVLAEVDVAYWDLVNALEALYANQRNLELVREEMARVERLYERRMATEYTLAQMKAELGRAEVQVEEARNAFLAASANLGEGIESSDQVLRETVYLPYGYSATLDEWITAGFDEAMAKARENRPDLRVSDADRRIADLNLLEAANQTEPDMRFTGSVGLRQSHSTYGYRDFWEANQNLFDPDSTSQNYALSYNRPWGNQAAMANYEIKRLGIEDVALGGEQTQDAAVSEIRTILSNLEAARAQARFADTEVERLRAAYEGLLRKQEIGADVTQLEVILTARNLLAAGLRRSLALTANKKAEGGLLAAQGILASSFGERAASTDFERQRLRTLARSGMLALFRPVE